MIAAASVPARAQQANAKITAQRYPDESRDRALFALPQNRIPGEAGSSFRSPYPNRIPGESRGPPFGF
jgi:hypothetical protein